MYTIMQNCAFSNMHISKSSPQKKFLKIVKIVIREIFILKTIIVTDRLAVNNILLAIDSFRENYRYIDKKKYTYRLYLERIV